MLRDVNVSVKDGGLGITSESGTAHVKIGVSTAPKNQMIIMRPTTDPTVIIDKLGHSPLADAVMESFQSGASTIYCIPATGEVLGSVGEVGELRTGLATFVVENKPNNDYEVIFEVVKAGGFNEATYRYSLDGGNNFTKEKTIPLDGIVALTGTNLVIRFTEAVNSADSFKIGDLIFFSTIAPTMTVQEVIDAVTIVKNAIIDVEYIHIVGESDAPLWASLAVEAESLFSQYFKPLYFICEARNIAENETVEDYVEALIQARQTIDSYRIQVVAGRASISALDNNVKNANGAAIVTGLYSISKASQSIGEVRQFQLKNVIKLLPEGIEAYIDLLDQAQILTFRRYIGLDGFYVTNARMLAPENSDYQFAETVRVMNKAVKEVRKAALVHIQSQIDPTDVEGSIKAFKEYIQVPLERMMEGDNKDLLDGEVIIPEGQDIISTEVLKVKVRAVPIPIMRAIDIEFGLTNPFN